MKSFSARASRVADIILDDSCADKGTRTKKISRETLSMLKDLRQRLIKGIAGRSLLRHAAYGTGKLSSLTKYVYQNISSYCKKR